MQWRKRLYEIIEPSGEGDLTSTIYDYGMIAVIVISLIPLAFKETTPVFEMIDTAAATIFLIDYALRLLTADCKFGNGILSFLRYPFSPMAIVDLAAILPTFLPLSPGFRLFKLFRLLRSFRVFRAFKMFRYSKSVAIILEVMQNQKEALLAVCSMAVAYIVIAALVIFNVEPDTFDTFFDAIYWATVSLTTMGYGDIYPVSTAGRIVTMLSSFMGIAIVALPAGIITAGYMDALGKQNNLKDREEKENSDDSNSGGR
ncbi:MAG: ion transporter [Lachnospiraceae bacterium]|nr:ion transporter [Lachnospiraceae bacterium]